MAPSRSTDPALVAEIALTLLLIALGIYFYLRPAAEGLGGAEWWHWVLLAGLFFSILALHNWRKRRGGHRGLHEAIREDARRRARTE